MSCRIREIIEAALRPLIGLPFTIARHAADMPMLHFGEIRSHPTGRGTTGEYSLHVQCSWRITNPHQIITGYSDAFLGPDADSEPDPDDLKTGNLQKVRLLHLMGAFDEQTRSPVDLSGQRVVTAVKADNYGSVDIDFSDSTSLQIFADSSAAEDWRLVPFDKTRDHFVIVGGKVQE